MKKLVFAIVLGLSVATISARQAAPQRIDPTGTWAIPDTPWSIVLKLEGTTLTGEVIQGAQKFEIKDGKVEGSTVSFTATVPTGERTMTFVGKITGTEIAFTRTVEIKPGGAPGGAALMGANGPSEFKANRALADTDVWSGTLRNLPPPNANPNFNPNPRPATVAIRQIADPHWRWRGDGKQTATRVFVQANQATPLNTFNVTPDKVSFTYSQGPQSVPWSCDLAKQPDGQFAGICRPGNGGNQRLGLTLAPPKDAAKRP